MSSYEEKLLRYRIVLGLGRAHGRHDRALRLRLGPGKDHMTQNPGNVAVEIFDGRPAAASRSSVSQVDLDVLVLVLGLSPALYIPERQIR